MIFFLLLKKKKSEIVYNRPDQTAMHFFPPFMVHHGENAFKVHTGGWKCDKSCKFKKKPTNLIDVRPIKVTDSYIMTKFKIKMCYRCLIKSTFMSFLLLLCLVTLS